jgi:hypothetical protein
MVNIQFSPTLRPAARSFALLLTALVALIVGCQGQAKPPKLTHEETLLVAELVQLHRLQILQDTNPTLADSLRSALQISLDGATLETKLRSLGNDPSRGAALLRAVRDSLAANRRELFGSASGLEDPSERERATYGENLRAVDDERDDD